MLNNIGTPQLTEVDYSYVSPKQVFFSLSQNGESNPCLGFESQWSRWAPGQTWALCTKFRLSTTSALLDQAQGPCAAPAWAHKLGFGPMFCMLRLGLNTSPTCSLGPAH